MALECFDQDVKTMRWSQEGVGIVKLSQYLCELVCLEAGKLTRPDKGSTWALLPNNHVVR